MTGGIPDTAVTRVVFTPRDLEARAWLEAAAPRRPACPSAKTPSATPSSAGKAPHRSCPRSPRARTSTPSPTPGCTTGRSASWVGSRPSAPCRPRAFTPTRSIELILFTSEEPTRFGIGCLGSRLMSGTLAPAAAAALEDPARRPCTPGRGSQDRRLHRRPRLRPDEAGPLRRLRGAAHRAGPAARATRHRTSASSRRSPRPPPATSPSAAWAATPERC